MTLILEPEKFSQLPEAGPLTGPEIIPIVQGGVNKQTTVDDLPATAVKSVNSQIGDVVLDQDDILDGLNYKQYSNSDKTKLAGIEAGAEVNNISDANASDLTDGGDTTLHKHDDRYYTESETSTLLSAKEDTANKGIANGYASLDAGGKVPVAQLPASVMTYLGTWDASTNTPTLANGTGDQGDLYIVSAAGTVDFGAGPITFEVGDWVMYNGSIWQRSDMSDAVSSVFGRQGAVIAANGDYTASQVTNVAAGNIAATTVQAAVNELDTEKVAKAGDTMTGALTTPQIIMNSTTTGITGNATSSLLRIFGGTLADGGGIILGGSTNGGAPNSILFRVGATNVMTMGTGGLGITSLPTHSLTLGSTATGIVLYNTVDQTTNYERGRLAWSSNILELRVEKGGSGTDRQFRLVANGTTFDVRGDNISGAIAYNRTVSLNNGVIMGIGGSLTSTSTVNYGLSIAPTINQSSTAGYTALLVNPTETATGSGTKLLADFQVGGTSLVRISNAGAVTAPLVINTSNAVTVAAGAATVPVTRQLTTVTNNAASAVTITIATSGAVDGQRLVVRFYDFSAAAQTISWVNTENSTTSVPTASNGSTTLPLNVGFQYNSATSRWRCLAVA